MNAPLRVPTRTRTPLICQSSVVVRPPQERTFSDFFTPKCFFSLRLKREPNFHASHSSLRIEFLGVTLEKVRRANGSAGDMKSGA